MTYYVSSVKFQKMLVDMNYNFKRLNLYLNIVYGGMAILYISLMTAYGVEENKSQVKADKKQLRYFKGFLYSIPPINTIVFLIIALWRLVKVMRNRIASKIAVNKTAISIHLICFTIYAII